MSGFPIKLVFSAIISNSWTQSGIIQMQINIISVHTTHLKIFRPLVNKHTTGWAGLQSRNGVWGRFFSVFSCQKMTFFLCRMKIGRAPFLFLNRNDIWVLALYVSRFRLVLATWEEICVRRPCFPIMSNLARTWKLDRLTGYLPEGSPSPYSFPVTLIKKSTIQVQQ